PENGLANEINENNITVNKVEDIEKVFDLGTEVYENQDFQSAINIFTKITDKFPGHGESHYYIGLSYFGLGEYFHSLVSFLRANKIFGNERLDALYGAGLAYLSTGYTEEAKQA